MIRRMLREHRRIAVVGLSANPDRPSFEVAEYMQARGYEIVPVNPNCVRVLGEKSYASLEEVPGEIGIVDVFRRAENTPEVAHAAAKVGAKALWLQLGVISEESARIARDGGMEVVMDRCIKIEHERLFGN
ncbi:MAG: CoA-binding protein [Gammaproteobacteria bacterium]|nr:CoA-binding protein [Gammaproteobacteria bacterium]